ncbi:MULTISPECIES: phosphate signaling complex PhoU family protein [Butyricimonas]|uniref:phosphate signaling complex PhoU family protein n=1 Tax=Butyricimonas TaxID=574697 RepID=UPI001D0653F4|nr:MULTISPECIES: PhoU domain-containing protein [Butyricimonas]MCB6972701.1 phosphate uptake regulator PhoU [Butyricimonas synergistica]MCG4519709.1 phosphate uptake regulator PhoU [Butyricimonas sp. DFI.6.44]
MTTIREKYLEKIKEDFEVLSTVVIQQMDIVFTLTGSNKDAKLHDKIEHNEVIIDGLEVKIRDEVINSIVLYCPRASDCRKIMSYHDMTAYLERIGDLLLNIADFLREVELQGELYTLFREIIRKQLEIVKKMTQNAIFAFTCEDENLAKEIIRTDDIVDKNHKEIVHGIPLHFVGRTVKDQDLLDALSLSNMSYNIERIGDNATNIAEAAIYLMEGKNAKHIHNN